jgi:hypothetical protein
LKEVHWQGAPNELMAHQDTLKVFSKHPPATVAAAAATITELTGISRKPTQVRQFLKQMGMAPRKVAAMRETFNNVPTTGCLLIGEKGTLSAGLWNNDCYLKLKNEPKFRGADNHDAGKVVPKTLPRVQGHMRETAPGPGPLIRRPRKA